MKKFSLILVLLLCVMFILALTGCERNYKVDSVSFSVYGYSSWSVDYKFDISGLPKGRCEFEFTYKLIDDNLKVIYSGKEEVKVTVKDDVVKVGGYLDLPRSAFENAEDVKYIRISDIKILSTVNDNASRLKPYAITIGVISLLGAVALITLCAVNEYKNKQNNDGDKN